MRHAGSLVRRLLFLAAWSPIAVASAQQAAPAVDRSDVAQSVKPGINDAYLDPELNVQEWVDRFEVESREVFAARDEIVAALKLKKGDRVADIGAGTGAFVEPLSSAVGRTGWLYALDIAPKFVQRIEKLAEIRSVLNVTPVLCSEDDVRLAPATIDVAFICDVYHHFEYPELSLASIHRALKPGGTLAVVDFERIEGVSREWVLGHVRAGKETFRKEIEQAGFEFLEEVKLDQLEENYLIRFRRP